MGGLGFFAPIHSFDDPSSEARPLFKSEDAMTLKLVRRYFTPTSTIGELYIGEIFECYTLEDTYRIGDIYIVKVPGKTAIPCGAYLVTIDQSARFKCLMPHVLNVPNFEGIRIHPGNSSEDTEGCILVGRVRGDNTISESRKAFEDLFAKLQMAQSAGEKMMLTIINEVSV
jgi:hypothetical protein